MNDVLLTAAGAVGIAGINAAVWLAHARSPYPSRIMRRDQDALAAYMDSRLPGELCRAVPTEEWTSTDLLELDRAPVTEAWTYKAEVLEVRP